MRKQRNRTVRCSTRRQNHELFEGIPISQDVNPTRPVAVRPRVQIVAVLPLIWGTIARSLKEILKVPDL